MRLLKINRSHQLGKEFQTLKRQTWENYGMKCLIAFSLTSLPRQFRSFLAACAHRSCLPAGKQLHAVILTTGLAGGKNTFLLNAVLHLYSSCGVTKSARHLFDQIPHSQKDAADWTALLSCLAQRGSDPLGALSLFREARRESICVDDVMMVCVLGLCARIGDLRMGSQAHGYLVRAGLGCGIKVCNATMNMYVKCGLLDDARSVFDGMEERNVISWSVILEGVVRWEGVERGRLVFDEMPEGNEVSWTVMISGYVGNGFTREGFSLLDHMVLGLGFGLNFVALCSFLSACAQSGDVVVGKWVHVYALKEMGREIDIMVGTALVDMYAKCGSIGMAFATFEYLPRRNAVAWNAMLGGLASHGRGKDVLDLLPKMVEEIKPDDLTFMAVLSACSHSGLVDQGRAYFDTLGSEYGITPKVEHYACMVDLLGRAGRLEEAEMLIKRMPMPPNEVVLGSLIGSCSAHGKLDLAERILRYLVEMDPDNTEYHVLISNMYVLAGKKTMANSVRELLLTKGVRKVPGMSSIHVAGQVHRFCAGDKSHPRTEEIYWQLDDMIWRLRLAGYTPDSSFQAFSGFESLDLTEEAEDKEQALFSHSEKLAVCFGLISTAPGVALYIFKNLRICRDCHSAIRIASRVYNREIIVRDRNRFHHFKHGSCSCSDYW